MPSNLTVVDGVPTYREGADTHVVAWKIRQGNEWGPFLIPWNDLRPETTRFELHRSVDGGQTWELVLSTTTPTSLTDCQGLSSGDTTYRLVAYTNAGAASETIIILGAESPALWIASGQSWEQAARLPYNPEVEASTGRERSLEQYEGETLPVAYAGDAISREWPLSGRIIDTDPDNASWGAFRSVVEAPDPLLLYRDPLGTRAWVMPGQLQSQRLNWGAWDWSVTLTQGKGPYDD